jgi:hypothetical protein
MPIEHDSNRSDRLLRTMRPVLSHDLPNQLVALQGLLQMLELDEAASLGAPAQETVFRLQRVARRTCEMARFLREVERLGSYQCRLEEVQLARLMREVQGELQQRCPDVALACAFAGDVNTVFADARLLTHALVEVLRCLVDNKTGTMALQLTARHLGQDTELRGELRWPSTPAASAIRPVQSDCPRLNKRLEIVLAQELLAACGGRLTQVQENADCSPFALLLPRRIAHA